MHLPKSPLSAEKSLICQQKSPPCQQKSPTCQQKSATDMQTRLIHEQQRLGDEQKSPTFVYKSPICQQKSQRTFIYGFVELFCQIIRRDVRRIQSSIYEQKSPIYLPKASALWCEVLRQYTTYVITYMHVYIQTYVHNIHNYIFTHVRNRAMGWLQLVGSIKL